MGRGRGRAHRRRRGEEAQRELRQYQDVCRDGPQAAGVATQALHAGEVRGHRPVPHEEGDGDVPLYWDPFHAAGEKLDPEEHSGLKGDWGSLLHTEKLLGTSREMAVQFTVQAGPGGAGRLRADAQTFWVQVCEQRRNVNK